MRPQTRTVLAVVALTLLVAIAGCADSGTTEPTDGPSAESIQEEAAAVAGNLSSAAFSMTMNVESDQVSGTLTADGVVDVAERRMRMNITTDSRGQTTEITQYIVNETAYQGRNGQWQSLDLTGVGIWVGGNQLSMQRLMLTNSTLNVTGTDVIAGNETWVVSVQPSDGGVEQFLTGTTTDVTENQDIQNGSATLYIDTDTYHVRKLVITLEATAEGDTRRIELSQTFSRFNEAFDIQLPDEAG